MSHHAYCGDVVLETLGNFIGSNGRIIVVEGDEYRYDKFPALKRCFFV